MLPISVVPVTKTARRTMTARKTMASPAAMTMMTMTIMTLDNNRKCQIADNKYNNSNSKDMGQPSNRDNKRICSR